MFNLNDIYKYAFLFLATAQICPTRKDGMGTFFQYYYFFLIPLWYLFSRRLNFAIFAI